MFGDKPNKRLRLEAKESSRRILKTSRYSRFYPSDPVHYTIIPVAMVRYTVNTRPIESNSISRRVRTSTSRVSCCRVLSQMSYVTLPRRLRKKSSNSIPQEKLNEAVMVLNKSLQVHSPLLTRRRCLYLTIYYRKSTCKT